MSNAVNATTPVGRLVRGSLYKPNDKDAEGKPLVVKSGPQMGQPRLDYFFAIAIPKGTEGHWSQTPWGAEILKVGAAAFPQAYQSPAFAWKVTDGDSQVPNKRGKKPCDNEGYKGHWVVGFSSGFPPNIYKLRPGTKDQFDPFNDADAIKLGYYVQVNFTAAGNGSQSQPGVFLNHRMVCFSAYGTEIAVGPDASSAGFGQAPLPAGASATPPAGAFNAASATPAIPGAVPPLVPGAVPGLGSAPAVGVMPQPATIGAPAAAPTLAVNPTLQPVPGAAHSIEALRAAHWTDDQIVAGGYATRIAAAAPAPLVPTYSAPAPGVPSVPTAPAPIAVTPNPQFVQVPAAPAVPAVPAAPAAGLVMQPAANGATYDAYRAAGWSDEQMIAAGVAARAA